MAIQFNLNALSRFSNVNFGDNDAIANLDGGNGSAAPAPRLRHLPLPRPRPRHIRRALSRRAAIFAAFSARFRQFRKNTPLTFRGINAILALLFVWGAIPLNGKENRKWRHRA